MLDVKAMQRALGVNPDGNDGRMTYTTLFQKLGAPTSTAAALGLSASVNFARYGITSNATNLANFLGQTSVESGNYHYMREIWGPTPTQAGYEGRRDLGNAQPGDGKLYLGRGVLQVTGRSNYRAISAEMGIDVEATPTLLERPDMGLWAACIWWADNKAANYADPRAVSRLVNRGNAQSALAANHEAERIAATQRARALLGQ